MFGTSGVIQRPPECSWKSYRREREYIFANGPVDTTGSLYQLSITGWMFYEDAEAKAKEILEEMKDSI